MPKIIHCAAFITILFLHPTGVGVHIGLREASVPRARYALAGSGWSIKSLTEAKLAFVIHCPQRSGCLFHALYLPVEPA
jgi:hypothetical protein